MTAKLYGIEDRTMIVELLNELANNESMLNEIALSRGDGVVADLNGVVYHISADELASVFTTRIDTITAKLKAKNIELANAPDAPLSSITRALEKQHEESFPTGIDLPARLPAGNTEQRA